jgi:hypothetical protein
MMSVLLTSRPLMPMASAPISMARSMNSEIGTLIPRLVTS